MTGNEVDENGAERSPEQSLERSKRRVRWLRRGAAGVGAIGALSIGASFLGPDTLAPGMAAIGLALAIVGVSQRRYAGAIVGDSMVDRRRLRRGGGVILLAGVALAIVGVWLSLF